MAPVSNFIAKLNSRGALLVSGPEARRFLQGQVSCDVDLLHSDRALPGTCCTPQGRMVCDFLLQLVDADSCLLSMHDSLCAEAAAVLGKYIVFSKAELAVVSKDWAHYAVWGSEAAARLGLQTDTDGCTQLRDGVCYTQIESAQMNGAPANGAGQRFEIAAPAALESALVARWQPLFEPADENAWQLCNIAAGAAHLEAATSGMFLPQMLNFQFTGHVSFSKGCYTGQEVVARLHYRGQTKRPLYRATLLPDTAPGPLPAAGAAPAAGASPASGAAPAAGTPHAAGASPATGTSPAAGTPLLRAGSRQAVGHIVSAARGDDGLELLVTVSREATAADVYIAEQPALVLKFWELHPPDNAA